MEKYRMGENIIGEQQFAQNNFLIASKGDDPFEMSLDKCI